MLDSFIENLKHPGSTKATNVIDKLNFQLTTITFFSLALLSTLKSYVGDPIDCWTPEYFTTQWIQYVDNICWMRNTYYIPDHMSVGEARDELNIDWELAYYQWVPIILGMLSFSFYLPNFFWHATMKHTININAYVERFTETENETNVWKLYETFDAASKTLDHYLRQRQLQNEHLGLRPSSCHSFNLFRVYHHNRVSVIYLIIKLIYIMVALVDLWFLTIFFGNDFFYFGVTVSKLFIENGASERMVTSLFPKITLCDFHVRETGYVKTYTVMCVLTINLFTEKIFLIVWTILVLNIVLTSLNLIMWLWRLAIPCNRINYTITAVKRASRRFGVEYYKLADHRTSLEKFVNEYLRPDGVLILRMVEINTSRTFGCAFTRWVYAKFMEEEEKTMEKLRQPQKPNFGVNRVIQPSVSFNRTNSLGPLTKHIKPPPSYLAANSRDFSRNGTISSHNGASDEPDKAPVIGSPMSTMIFQPGTYGRNRSLSRPHESKPRPTKRPDNRYKLLESFIENPPNYPK